MTEIWVNIIIPIIIGPIFIFFKMLYDNNNEKKQKHKMLIYNEKYEKLNNILTNFYWPLYIKLLCIYQLNYQIPIKNEFEYISSSEDSDDCECDENEMNLDNLNKCKNCNRIIPNNCKICVKCKWKNVKDMIIDDGYIDDNPINNNNNISINIPIENELYNSDSDSYENNKYRNKNIILDENTINCMQDELNKLFGETLNIIEKNMHNVGFSKQLNKNLILFIKYIKIRKIINEGSINKKYDIKYFGVTNNINTLLSLVELKLFENQEKYNNLIENGPFK